MTFRNLSLLTSTLLSSHMAMADTNAEIKELRQQINALAQQVDNTSHSSSSGAGKSI